MKIILSNCIEIREPTKEMIKFCRKELTYKNPDVEKKKRMGFYTYGMSKEIKLYNEYNGNLYIPIGCFEMLYKFHPVSSDYIDCTISKKANIKSSITLRNYQEFGLRAIDEHYLGLFVLPCGLGKTELALQCAYHLQQKTIWITHTTDLVKQAKDRCSSKMSCKVSTITEGTCDTSGDIVFCTIQTLYKMIEKGKVKQDEFGFLIADECHRVATNPSTIEMFRTCVDYFACRYKLGLTATLHRADGLHDCITKIIGNVIYEVAKRDDKYCSIYENKILLKFDVAQFQVPAHITAIETNYNLDGKEVFAPNGGTIQFASLISDLAMNKERNTHILNVLHDLNGSTLILSDRVEQLKFLCSHVSSGVQIDGSTPKKQREKAIQDVKDGKIQCLFASYSLAKEGLDVPIIENLVMATPVKDFAIVQQSVGRIQRPCGDKKIANVYDFIDDVGMLKVFFAKRRTTYRKNNWKIDTVFRGGE